MILNILKKFEFYYHYTLGAPGRWVSNLLTYWTVQPGANVAQYGMALVAIISVIAQMCSVFVMADFSKNESFPEASLWQWLAINVVTSYVLQHLANVCPNILTFNNQAERRSVLAIYFSLPALINSSIALAMITTVDRLVDHGKLPDYAFVLALWFYFPYALILLLILIVKDNPALSASIRFLSFYRPLLRSSPYFDIGGVVQESMHASILCIRTTSREWSDEDKYAHATALLSTYRSTQTLPSLLTNGTGYHFGKTPPTGPTLSNNTQDVISMTLKDTAFCRNLMFSALMVNNIDMAVQLYEQHHFTPRWWMTQTHKQWLSVLKLDEKSRSAHAANEITQTFSQYSNQSGLDAFVMQTLKKYNGSPIHMLSLVPQQCRPVLLTSMT